jgi:hypothetical protein
MSNFEFCPWFQTCFGFLKVIQMLIMFVICTMSGCHYVPMEMVSCECEYL